VFIAAVLVLFMFRLRAGEVLRRARRGKGSEGGRKPSPGWDCSGGGVMLLDFDWLMMAIGGNALVNELFPEIK